MVSLMTTARKALVAALAGFISPLYVLVQSELPIDGRSVLACALAGLLAGVLTFEVPNTDEYKPERKHAADQVKQ